MTRMKVPAGVRLRQARTADAAALLTLMRSLDLETSFMLREPDERTEDEDDIAADLAAKVAAANSVVMLAEADGRLIGYAEAHGIHRLELTVMAHNERAAALYQRVGYTVEGRARECLFVDGRMADELYMAKLFPPP
jgi:GNAT superfamily N-acetyltransferase